MKWSAGKIVALVLVAALAWAWSNPAGGGHESTSAAFAQTPENSSASNRTPATSQPTIASQPAAIRPALSTHATMPAARRYANARVDISSLPKIWYTRTTPSVPRPALPGAIKTAYIIPIHGEIDETTYDAVSRKAIQARGRGAEIIIFDMDTPGGRSDIMDKIARLITTDLQNIYTVAYVHPRAFSAGAVISLACSEIAMAPNGIIGDAMPIMFGSQGLQEMPEKERGKFESAMRAEIRELATRNGYCVPLCEAMITITMEIWLVRDKNSGELVIVDADKVRDLVANTPASATQPAGTAAREAQYQYDYLLTIDGPKELVTMTAKEAVRLGFADHIFPTYKELKEHYNIAAEPVNLEDTWSEQLVGFLTSPMVTGILFAIAIICVYAEANHPGVVLPGVTAVVCFAIIFGSKYLVGMAQWWEIAVFAVGVLLILVELFMLPGFGVPGILGIILCVVGLVTMLIPTSPGEFPIPHTEMDWSLFTNGLFSMGVGFICALIGAAILSRYLPKMPLAGRLVLAPTTAVPDSSLADDSPMRHLNPGDRGVVASVCRPVGKVRFGDALVDAASEGQIIETGSAVRILRREGNHVIVEKVT